MANETNPPKDKGKGPAQPVDLQDLRAQVHAESEDDAEGGSFLSMGQPEQSHQQGQQPSGSNLQAPFRGRQLASNTIEAEEAEELEAEDDPRPERFGKNHATIAWLDRNQRRSHQQLFRQEKKDS